MEDPQEDLMMQRLLYTSRQCTVGKSLGWAGLWSMKFCLFSRILVFFVHVFLYCICIWAILNVFVILIFVVSLFFWFSCQYMPSDWLETLQRKPLARQGDYLHSDQVEESVICTVCYAPHRVGSLSVDDCRLSVRLSVPWLTLSREWKGIASWKLARRKPGDPWPHLEVKMSNTCWGHFAATQLVYFRGTLM